MSRKKSKIQNNFFRLVARFFPPLCLLLLIFPGQATAVMEEEKTLFGFINSDRAREELPELVWDDDLYAVAQQHSKDMAGRGFVGHAGSDGSQPHGRVLEAGIYASQIAENVARDINIISAHTSLMESLYHRKNILDPRVTHAAVSIVSKNHYLYVTELFIRKLVEIPEAEGRQKLLQVVNDFREKEGLPPVALSQALTRAAHAHIELQKKAPDLNQPLITSLIAKQLRGQIRVNVYTTSDFSRLPTEVQQSLRTNIPSAGIGFQRIRGKLCESGCYLVTFVFGPGQ